LIKTAALANACAAVFIFCAAAVHGGRAAGNGQMLTVSGASQRPDFVQFVSVQIPRACSKMKGNPKEFCFTTLQLHRDKV
jgi:hypothetical protein